MLHRDLPFGLARHRAHAEPFVDRQSASATSTLSRQFFGGSRISTRKMTQEDRNVHVEALPEDVIFIILGYLTVAEIMVARRCSKCFKRLTENRQLWINFVSHPYFPTLASAPQISTQSVPELEALVRRQFELSRTWSPKSNTTSPIPIRRSYRFSMPNNESLTAMSSMNSWVAVASDLGGVYVCAPFGQKRISWIRVLSVPVEITKLCVAVWYESGNEHVAVMWAGRANAQDLEFQCGLVTASAEDLIAAQTRAQGGIVLSTSDFVSSLTIQIRNPASEIMDIAVGERYCAIVDAAHVIQVFMHRVADYESTGPLSRSEFSAPRSSRKTVSLHFLPYNQLLVRSDGFIAVYKPTSLDSSTMRHRYFTRLPSTHFFGLLAQHHSSTIPSVGDYMSVPLLALGSNGKEVTHFDIRVASAEVDVSGVSDYGLSLRRSLSYLLAPWLQPFSLGTINGGHSRLVWITSGKGRPFGIALGRSGTSHSDPTASYQSPLDRTAIDLGEYGAALVEQAPLGPLFVFHEGEGKLLGGVRRTPDLFMLEY